MKKQDKKSRYSFNTDIHCAFSQGTSALTGFLYFVPNILSRFVVNNLTPLGL